MNGYKAPNSITPSSTRSSEVGLGTQASTACMAGQDAAELRAEAAALVSNRRLHALALERVGPVSVENPPLSATSENKCCMQAASCKRALALCLRIAAATA